MVRAEATGARSPAVPDFARHVANRSARGTEGVMGLNWTPSSAAVPGGPLTRVAPAKRGIAPDRDAFERLAQRIRAEYLEMPGLNLTRSQAQCLWGLDASQCERMLAFLVETGFLAHTAHDTYVRTGGH